MKSQSSRSNRANKPFPVYRAAAVLVFLGVVSVYVSWKIEEAQEALLKAYSAPTQSTAVRETRDNPSAGNSQSMTSATVQTALPNFGLGFEFTNSRWRIVGKGFGELGLALISVGLIALLLEVRMMSEYFETKIARSMIGHGYLEQLTKDELDQLQANSLRAFWGLDEKERKDLLDYCKDQVHRYIADPYRENVIGDFQIKPVEDHAELHEVREEISWTCRAPKGRIQNEVRWTTRVGEINGLDEFEIKLEIPLDQWKLPDFKLRHPHIDQRITIFNKNQKPAGVQILRSIRSRFNEFWKSVHTTEPATVENNEVDGDLEADTKGRLDAFLDSTLNRAELEKLPDKEVRDREGFRLSLADYADVDELHVTVITKYKAPASRSLTWQMSHPSRNVIGFVNFEQGTFFLETFGVPVDSLDHWNKPEETRQRFEYSSWVLPECGFVFHFLPKKESTAVPVGRESEVL